MKDRLKNVYVNPQKISDYLLNVNHQDGASKAKLLISFGFDIEAPSTLQDLIINHAISNDVSKVIITGFGEKYLVEGAIKTPSGKLLPVRSVWIKEHNEEIVKFVTLYPI